jgi:hypothetical protein
MRPSEQADQWLDVTGKGGLQAGPTQLRGDGTVEPYRSPGIQSVPEMQVPRPRP